MRPIRKAVSLVAFAIGSVVAAGSAFAGDLPLPTKADPLVTATYDWSGLHIGGHLGGAFESTAFQDPSLAGTLICCDLIGLVAPNAAVSNGGAGGFLGGAQAGWNYQIGRFVFGTEVDFSGTNLSSTRSGTAPAGTAGGIPATESFSIHTDWTATATLNAGIATDRWLWYGKAGAALAHDTYGLGLGGTFSCFGCAVGPLSFASSGGEVRPGWTFGAGFAWAFSGNWVATIEYDYLYFAAKPVDFSGTVFSGTGPYVNATLGTNSSQQISEVKLGLDYKFGSPNTAPPESIFAAATPPLFNSASAPINAYNWSGFYVGGHLGGGWQQTDFQDPSAGGVIANCCAAFSNMTQGASAPNAFAGSFLGGVQGGWNYQIGRLVVGANGAFTGTNLNTTNVGIMPGLTPASAAAAAESFGVRTDWTATATALFGVTNDRWLFYSKLGAAWAHDNYSLGVTGPNTGFFALPGSFSFAQSASEIRTGLTVGTGLSWALSAHWVASIEYDFLYFPTKEVDFTGTVANAATGAGLFTGPVTFSANNSQQISQVKLALDYKFTPGGGTAETGPFFASAQPVFASAAQPITGGHDWSGVYVGGHIGGGLSNAAMQDPSLASVLADCCYGIFTQFISNAAIPNASGAAFLGGAQAGWNYQVGRFVVGSDFDFSATNLNAGATGVSQATAGLSASETLSVRTDWTATATATFGFAALDRLLWYNKVGIAWAHDTYGYNLAGIGTGVACCGPVALTPFGFQSSAGAIVTGWTIGTGLARAFTDHWSARIEYDYLNFGSKAVDFSGFTANLQGATNRFTSNTLFSQQISEVKLGVNYKFASSLLFW